uniref:N-acetyltransferase domain-containing protein n=1 Tax=viral metagenome TaxID=1070528 RepID=A0A6C0DR42_9ZZZZ
MVESKAKFSEIKTNYVKLLEELSVVQEISDDFFFENIVKINAMGKIIVAIEENKIIATGTIIIEPKILRGGMSVGHIEDIVVTEKYRGKGIAQELVEQLKQYGFTKNCYKIILDCKENLEPFYKKSGFSHIGIQMGVYFEGTMFLEPAPPRTQPSNATSSTLFTPGSLGE